MNQKLGYIKLYRTIAENEIYQLPPLYLRVFERLILEANHQDNEIPYRKNGKVETKVVKRGEKLTSIRQISEWVGWYERGVFKKPNPKIVKEILDYLAENEMIFIYDKSNRTETHYKVVNYNVYQDKDDIKVTEQKQNRNGIETEEKRLAPQNNNEEECFKNEEECFKNENKGDKKHIVEKLDREYSEIINYLNLVCGTRFKANTRQTKDLIRVRIKEGFTVDDFKTVIDKKHLEWGINPNMAQYLRPQTLFGTKFESYLNQPDTDGRKLSETDKALIRFMNKDDLPELPKLGDGDYF